MKIMVTGGCGFLGCNLGQRILRNGDELVVLDNLYRLGSADNLRWLREQGDFTSIHADIRDTNDVEKAIEKNRPDVIFHLAGQVAMTTSIENPRLDFEVNVGGTFNVLEAIRKHCPKTIMAYSSTNKVYGDLENIRYEETTKRFKAVDYPNGFDEKTPLDFHSPYGCSKGAADQYVLDYARIFGLRTVVFRHSSIFGGRQFATYDQGWVGWFCLKALEKKANPNAEKFTISGNGKQVRDILFASDLVECYLSVIPRIDNVKGQAFNIGGGMENSLSLLELFDILSSQLDVKMDYREIPWRESDQKVFVADISKVRKMLGWEPKVDKVSGVRNMIEWCSQLIKT
ncbi:MAG: GDP-mannose 4,6-dehydratase [Methanomassiliicoccales archaeon]|jgi:CDP-paratose 2-epimerase